ncbi:MAG: hypothetical protein CUN53_01240 [Phototrophicales bacterium]|nr:MAG: hypothetical protein CUN53_01240 [Phototrophicales bacterium]
MTETTTETDAPVQATRRSPLRRIGCGIALTLWFLLLLTPCIMVYAATQGEITIPQGDLPGQVIRLWMIQEARLQGIGVSSTSVLTIDSDTRCLQTDNRFLLWRGSELPVTYCECFRRERDGAGWDFISGAEGVCTPATLQSEEMLP